MKKKNIIIIFLLFSAIVILYFLWILFGNSGKDEVYLLPKDYTGIVTIIFEQEEGVPLTISNGQIIFVIPTGGILITKDRKPTGFHNEYYYYTDGFNKIRIPFSIPSDTTNKETQIFGLISGTTYSGSGKLITYSQFIVGKISMVDSLFKIRDKSNPGKFGK